MNSEETKIIMAKRSIRPYELENFDVEVNDCCNWLTLECGLKVNGRIQEYKKKIKGIDKYRGLFSNEMYYIFQSFNEVNQIINIYRNLSDKKNKNFLQTLKKSIKGISFRNSPEKSNVDQARNHIFELLIASDFVQAGRKVDLSQRADIVLKDEKLLIECKRVKSQSALLERTKEAIRQINTDVSQFSGLIYIDITELFDDLHEIFLVDEQGAFATISEPEEIAAMINQKLTTIVKDTIVSSRKKLVKMIDENPKIHSINLVVNFVGLHLSILHEDVILGRAIYLVNDVDIRHRNQFKNI